MWRRYGDAVYALVILVVFSLQAAGLAFLTWAFLLHRSALRPETSPLERTLVAAVSLTALSLLVVTVYTLGYQASSTRRERARRRSVQKWTKRWTRVVMSDERPPTGPLSSFAIEALLGLRDVVRGEKGERVLDLIRRYKVDRTLLSRAHTRRFVLRGPRTLARRLEALEALARARLPAAVGSLNGLIGDPDPAVRVMALRAMARGASALPPGPVLDSACVRLVELFRRGDVPPGVVEEALLLLEGAAVPVVRGLLWPDRMHSAVPMALDAIGRLHLSDLAELAAAYVSHPMPEVRAAALRSLGLTATMPRGAEAAISGALSDPEEIVRIQAARSAYLLGVDAPPALWPRLGDSSWWVRRSAAWSLVRCGNEGRHALRRAADTHEDRYARQMAVQVLLDAGRLDAAGARRLRAAG